MIKNFIFDIGNVIVDFNPVLYFEKLLPEKYMKDVCGLVFNEDWEKLDEGVYSCEELKRIQLEKYPQYEEQICCIYEHWMEMMRLKSDTIAFIKEVKKQGYAVYLLSNIGEESHAYLQDTYGFFDLMDGGILSYQVKLIKPDQRIYEKLLDTYHLVAQECVFFDDKESNIEAAKRCGMHGIVFQNSEQAKVEVEHVIHQ